MNSSTEHREGASQACGFSHCLERLRDLPLFSGVSLDVVKVLAYLSETDTFTPGEALCGQGETTERFYLVLCGEVSVWRRVGEAEVKLFSRGEGFFCGGLGLLGPAKSLFSVRAEGPVTCLALTREKFAKTVERFPDMVPRLLANVVEHVFRWEEGFLRAHPEACGRGEEMGLSLF